MVNKFGEQIKKIDKKIPYGKQDISDADIASVEKVLSSDFLTQGPEVGLFEKEVCDLVNSKYAVAVNSGTSALHIACLSLGLKRKDIIWTSPNTYVATANCGVYCGAEVDFVDIDLITWNLSTSKLEQKLIEAEKLNRLPKILISVDFSGQPVDQEKIWELSRKYKFKIIEDASHAIGAKHKNKMVGSNYWSDITIFSFHPVKIITSGEGGMALTNDEACYEEMKLLRSHGVTRDRDQLELNDSPAWYYEQQILGFNYRMTDIHAALGRSQLSRINEFLEIRNELALNYQKLLGDLPLQLPFIKEENFSSWHLYVVLVEANLAGTKRDHIFGKLREKGLGVNLHYYPVHLQPFYKKIFGFKKGDLPNAEEYSSRAITLPLYSSLTKEDQLIVFDFLQEILNES